MGPQETLESKVVALSASVALCRLPAGSRSKTTARPELSLACHCEASALSRSIQRPERVSVSLKPLCSSPWPCWVTVMAPLFLSVTLVRVPCLL
ncbi:hypothetical protein A7J05_00955 [Streptomyces alfalfae]|uniref:Uncharacterized protein n=1 Tax=Streptomyces alfalfae TaxID=1642299 RepID=A0ABN4VFC1_9ACTN|nr:hypothetical protein A7J05_00955 [Streptomyces alfalfae]